MKIVDVRTIPLTWNATNPCMSAGTVSSSRSALIVEIETDTGRRCFPARASMGAKAS